MNVLAGTAHRPNIHFVIIPIDPNSTIFMVIVVINIYSLQVKFLSNSPSHIPLNPSLYKDNNINPDF